MDFNLNLTQEQKLIMTQQMQLSVKLLQMSTHELQEYVDKEVQENPVLDVNYVEQEKVEGSRERLDLKELFKYLEFDNYGHNSYEKNDDEVSPFNFIAETCSLKNYLKNQVLELEKRENIKGIAIYIIENLDEKGYLDSSVESIAAQLKLPQAPIEEALNLVQSLEPAGIGARDLKECLKLQIYRKNKDDEVVFRIIDDFLEALAENKYSLIAKELGIDVKRAQQYGDFIKTLEPKPSRGFFTGEEVKYITPDAYIKKINDEFFILMNESVVPRLSINSIYKEIINNDSDKNAVSYVKDKMNSALFLIKSIEQRKSTVYRVLEKLLELQKEYFEKGDAYLRPMTLREIAESLNMHESTISRAIRDKYIHTSKGTIKIKSLFTVGLSSCGNEDVSAQIIKKAIKDLIDKEEQDKPFSDQKLCDLLNEAGMNISRRTVAKYREEMNIKSSSKRKRF